MTSGMKNNKKRILVTNDDGIDALGIKWLVAALCSRDDNDVYVVAPREQQSAKSQGITFLREVSVEERPGWLEDFLSDQEDMNPGREWKIACGVKRALALDGTPADCVKWAISYFKETEGIDFDYVFSGINMGSNVGAAVYYSGTVAATFEGALHGVHSIALSVSAHFATHFEYVCDELIELGMELSEGLSADTVLSFNSPNLPSSDIKGVRIVPVAPFNYGERFCFARAESGDYQLIAELEPAQGELSYDYDCVEAGYVSVSPLTIRISDTEALATLLDRKEN